MQEHNITTEEYFALPHASNSGIKAAYDLFVGGKEQYDPTVAFAQGSAFDAIMTEMQELKQDGIDMQNILRMRKSTLNDDIYKKIFAGQSNQLVLTNSLAVQHDGIDIIIPAKCKYDLFNKKFQLGGDLKSTVATSYSSFHAAAKHFEYNRQAAWYMDIAQINRFIIIGVSKKNHRVFHINITRDSDAYIEGKELYSKYAMAWWKLHPEMTLP